MVQMCIQNDVKFEHVIADTWFSSSETVAKVVYLKGLDLAVALTKKVFTNKDGSSGILYLVCNDTTLDGGQIYAIYKKRWKVEEYHKSLEFFQN